MDETATRALPAHQAGKTERARSDAALLELFDEEPLRAWELFIDRYADSIFASVRALGTDYDEVMDRFVYVCEKLVEDDYRRLRSVKYLGERGELTPWLRQVTKNLVINWVVSKEGRRRLLKPIEELSDLDQEVFKGRFWRGWSPSEIWGALRAGGNRDVRLLDILDSLDRVERKLTPKKRWRLMAQLLRRGPSPTLIEEQVADTHQRTGPERALLRNEAETRLRHALAQLTARERLLLQLRYEDSLPIAETARALRISQKEAKASLAFVRRRLRGLLQEADLSVEKEGEHEGAGGVSNDLPE